MECLHIFLSSGLAKTGSLADHKTTMAFNMTSIKTSSDGAWQGDNPLRFAFPLLIVQTTLVLSISRFLAFLLKPFHQPRVIAEIIVRLQSVLSNYLYMLRFFLSVAQK